MFQINVQPRSRRGAAGRCRHLEAVCRPCEPLQLEPGKPLHRAAVILIPGLHRLEIARRPPRLAQRRDNQRRGQRLPDRSVGTGNEQTFYWSSKAADEPGTRNYPGIKSPVVDALCQKITAATTREELVAAVRALDRVLLWGHYVVPGGHRTKDYIAYWDKIEHPPLGVMGIPSIHTFWTKDKN